MPHNWCWNEESPYPNWKCLNCGTRKFLDKESRPKIEQRISWYEDGLIFTYSCEDIIMKTVMEV